MRLLRPQVSDVADVASGLLGVDLPSKAYYGRRGETLSRLSRQELMVACDVWLDTCGADYTKRCGQARRVTRQLRMRALCVSHGRAWYAHAQSGCQPEVLTRATAICSGVSVWRGSPAREAPGAGGTRRRHAWLCAVLPSMHVDARLHACMFVDAYMYVRGCMCACAWVLACLFVVACMHVRLNLHAFMCAHACPCMPRSYLASRMRRFIEREPTLLARHPRELLEALELFSQMFCLDPAQSVQFALRNTAL
eukprot:354762-Chlamydomonas_euryale.AAC.1